jgi:hypothetical protein
VATFFVEIVLSEDYIRALSEAWRLAVREEAGTMYGQGGIGAFMHRRDRTWI